MKTNERGWAVIRWQDAVEREILELDQRIRLMQEFMKSHDFTALDDAMQRSARQEVCLRMELRALLADRLKVPA